MQRRVWRKDFIFYIKQLILHCFFLFIRKSPTKRKLEIQNRRGNIIELKIGNIVWGFFFLFSIQHLKNASELDKGNETRLKLSCFSSSSCWAPAPSTSFPDFRWHLFLPLTLKICPNDLVSWTFCCFFCASLLCCVSSSFQNHRRRNHRGSFSYVSSIFPMQRFRHRWHHEQVVCEILARLSFQLSRSFESLCVVPNLSYHLQPRRHLTRCCCAFCRYSKASSCQLGFFALAERNLSFREALGMVMGCVMESKLSWWRFSCHVALHVVCHELKFLYTRFSAP